MKTLYAILVGINDYPKGVPPLGGCENDVCRIKEMLEASQAEKFQLKIRLLLGRQATKGRVVHAIRNHFEAAKAGDTALFYFSGHGSQEAADEVFHLAEYDKRLECLVCWDSRLPGGSQLADKELRYLFHPIAAKGVHLVTIFDCCHSGDITRDDLVARMVPGTGVRTWENFIFHAEIPREKFRQAASLEDILPLGDHVRFSACEDEEVAYEKNEAGIFTTTLLDVMRYSGGDVTYSELANRIRHAIDRRKFPQNPTAVSPGSHPEMVHQPFLGGALANKNFQAQVTFNHDHQAWALDWGFIHGVPTGKQEMEKAIIRVVDESSDETFYPKLAAVHPDFSLLSFEKIPLWEKYKAYKAILEGVYPESLNIFCEGGGEAVSFAKSELEEMSDSLQRFGIRLSDDSQTADYLIVSTMVNGQSGYVLTRWPDPDEGEPLLPGGIPVSKPVLGQPEKAINEIARQLKHIQRWHQLKELKNPAQQVLPFEVKFTKITIDGEPIEDMDVQDGCIDLYFEKDSKGELTGYFRIKIQNCSTRNFHVALLYLSQDYLIHSNMLRQGVVNLEPGTSIFAFEGKIKMKYEKYIGDLGLPYSACWFKLIYSQERFSVHTLSQGGLLNDADKKQTRSNIDLEMDELSYSDKGEWGTATFMVKMRKPGMV